MKKSSPEYTSTYKNGPETYKSPSNLPRNKTISSSNPNHGNTGENTYAGPDKPSEGRSDRVSDRPPMSKKWIEK